MLKKSGLLKIYVKYVEISPRKTTHNDILELNLDAQKTVADIKKIVQKHFKLDTTNWIGSKSEKRIVLEYSRSIKKYIQFIKT